MPKKSCQFLYTEYAKKIGQDLGILNKEKKMLLQKAMSIQKGLNVFDKRLYRSCPMRCHEFFSYANTKNLLFQCQFARFIYCTGICTYLYMLHLYLYAYNMPKPIFSSIYSLREAAQKSCSLSGPTTRGGGGRLGR